MGNCPFWSTKVAKVSCNVECPMSITEEICAFKEISVESTFKFKDISETEFDIEDTKVFEIKGYMTESNY